MRLPDELTTDGLRRAVSELLPEPPEHIGDRDNLFALGLNSMGMIRLASAWQAHGVEVDVVDLAEEPTLAAWSRLVGEAYGASYSGEAAG
jgi:aryl carrier-like protein